MAAVPTTDEFASEISGFVRQLLSPSTDNELRLKLKRRLAERGITITTDEFDSEIASCISRAVDSNEDENLRIKAASRLVEIGVWKRRNVLPRGTPSKAALIRPPLSDQSKLIACLKTRNDELRHQIISVLGEWGDESAATAIKDLLEERQKTGDAKTQRYCISALASIGGPKAMQGLAWAAEQDSVREAALWAKRELETGGTLDYSEGTTAKRPLNLTSPEVNNINSSANAARGGRISTRSSTRSFSSIWPSAAAIAASLAIVGVVVLYARQVSATADHLKNEIAAKDVTIRDLNETLLRLQQSINKAKIRDSVKVFEPNGFSVVEPERNRIMTSGEFDPSFIQEVRLRWGIEPGSAAFITLHKGGPQPDSGADAIPLKKESSEMPLKGDAIVAVLEFIPYPAMKNQFPEYFPDNRMRYSRTFRLGRGGIVADPELVIITEPHDGQKVLRTENLAGRISSGYPVVLVKSDVGAEWHVQPFVDEFKDGDFTVLVYFGQQDTKPGTRFQVVVVAATSLEQARQEFKEGTILRSLPVNLPRSRAITVVRD